MVLNIFGSRNRENQEESNYHHQEQQATCRICFDDSKLFLLQPCECKGTAAYVHYHCLSTWLRISRQKHCDICKSEYKGFYTNLLILINYLHELNDNVDCKLQEFLTGVYLIFTVIICLIYAWYLQWTVNDEQHFNTYENDEQSNHQRQRKQSSITN